MLNYLEIENFKSIKKMMFEPGRINVLIGENGCGKSNILEALVLVSAAASYKLDNEFLSSRGIRVTKPNLMTSAFSDTNYNENILISINTNSPDGNHGFLNFTITNNNENFSNWISKVKYPETWLRSYFNTLYRSINEAMGKPITEQKAMKDYEKRQDKQYKRFFNLVTNQATNVHTNENDLNQPDIDKFHESITRTVLTKHASANPILKNFVIYSPENTALRNFYKEGQIEPLGINGEGLLKLLKIISSNSPADLDIIQEKLQKFSWFDHFEIPETLSANEDKITIVDKFLTSSFDQRSANEGFLFILFYMALIISEDTPKIFAIDNIDTSLNPLLCQSIIKDISCLAKEKDKQVFLTTHNPALLDGLDLTDDEQRLFVVSRSKKDGSTNIRRITAEDRPRTIDNNYMRLSEALLRGYFGGLPKGI